jgi:protein gp37
VPLYDGVTIWRRGRPVFNGRLAVLPAHHGGWTWPLSWRGAASPVMGDGKPSLIFVGDMTDLFIAGHPASVIDRVVATLIASPHIGLLLTKRPERMVAYFSAAQAAAVQRRRQLKVWLGFSAERQTEFDARWMHMRALAASGWTTFVSVAPMLAPVRLPPDFLAHGDHIWVICSGEQNCGGFRPMNPDWARALRDQCAAARVPFNMLRMSGGQAIPPDLLIRQFPRAA